MKQPVQTSRGFILFCEEDGRIDQVVHNNTGFPNLTIGSNLKELFTSETGDQIFDFLSKVNSEKLVFNWDCNTTQGSGLSVFQLFGAVVENRVLVLGGVLPVEVMNLFLHLIRVNNEQNNAVNSDIKKQEDADLSLQLKMQFIEEIPPENNQMIEKERELAYKNKTLADLQAEIQALSITDSLTGLLNQGGFMQKAEQAWVHAARYYRPLSVILFDIDQFKTVNDTHGANIGDDILRRVGQRCLKALRESDILCRFGGEEYCLLLPETGIRAARQVAEKLRRAIAKPYETDDGKLSITISLGVAERNDEMHGLPAVIKNAQHALNLAKAAGMNRTRVFVTEDEY